MKRARNSDSETHATSRTEIRQKSLKYLFLETPSMLDPSPKRKEKETRVQSKRLKGAKKDIWGRCRELTINAKLQIEALQSDLLGNWRSAPLQLTWPTCFQGYLQDSGSSPMNLQAQWWTQNVQSWPWSSIIHFGFCWIKKSKIFWSLFQCFRLMSRMHVFGWSGSIATFAGQN